jgi:hypothetical protein
MTAPIQALTISGSTPATQGVEVVVHVGEDTMDPTDWLYPTVPVPALVVHVISSSGSLMV